MTPGVMKYVASKVPLVTTPILEVGSLNINGSPRDAFGYLRSDSYFGIDLIDGPGVDEVMDCHALKFKDDIFNTVIDVERLEHDSNFYQSYSEIYRVLRPGGHVIVTARAWGGFHPHCLPHDYWRFTTEGLEFILRIAGLKILDVRYEEFWHAVRNCGETGGCVEHPHGGTHNDEFPHAVYGFAVKP